MTNDKGTNDKGMPNLVGHLPKSSQETKKLIDSSTESTEAKENSPRTGFPASPAMNLQPAISEVHRRLSRNVQDLGSGAEGASTAQVHWPASVQVEEVQYVRGVQRVERGVSAGDRAEWRCSMVVRSERRGNFGVYSPGRRDLFQGLIFSTISF